MRKKAYYNENNKYCADWLRNLIDAKLIAYGDVDDRSIADIHPKDLTGYVQCHFFAGIGGWPYAIKLAGVPDVFPAWTGSCPCQPFSQAGTQRGFDDDRHLWPVWFKLIEKCRPPIVLGEQVESHEGLEWLDLVSRDMESADYAFAAANLCAAGVGAPNIRQRLWFVSKSNGGNASAKRVQQSRQYGQRTQNDGVSKRMVDADETRLQGRIKRRNSSNQRSIRPPSMAGVVEYANKIRRDSRSDSEQRSFEKHGFRIDGVGSPSIANPWQSAEWIACTDGRYRPIEPGTQPLAHGVPQRLDQISAYGNAINPYVAKAFIEAVMQCLP